MSFPVSLIAVLRVHRSLFHSFRALLLLLFSTLQSLHLSSPPLLTLLSHPAPTPPSTLSPFARSLALRPQASCVYISVVYFYKCQTVFLPSVY